MELIGMRATLNEDTDRVTMSFFDAAPPDHQDPAAWQPTVTVTIHLPPGQVDIVPLPGAPADQQGDALPG